jgi:F-type H+-transporting ATPase subunit c
MDLHLPYVAAALGAGLAVVGGGLGIGRLAAAAMDGIARQPQAGGAIGTNMLIAAGLIEGVTLVAEVVAFLIVLQK